ncbi:MAG: glycosyltransferase family 1 protein [Opitutus sp.]|nr:glycosyltransferase family 1 protein [Opitutus sp.]
MIFFDVTKAGAAGHRSGLMRVSARLADGLGPAATEVRWPAWNRVVRPADWFLTGELFSEEERPGFTAFLATRPCRLAAIFHDAIPLKHPQITWPQSVARHPGYLKLLARFDRVWAVSATSRDELTGFWRWQGVANPPPVAVLALGADFNSAPRIASVAPRSALNPQLLCVGILEPRKNQALLLDVAEELWREGLRFELHVVGRVNPHFGPPIVARLKALRKKFPGRLRYHEAANDGAVAQLYATARASVFPTVAEGCGLPLLESLWLGVPCVCSDLPVLRENTDGGGCVPVALNDRTAWKAALRRVLTDDAHHTRLTTEATSRSLPTWTEAAQTILTGLRP